MSAHDNEDLVEYEDDQDLVTTSAAPAAQNGAADKDKKYAGIHSTGFRSVQYPPTCQPQRLNIWAVTSY
jgi:ATP-dependent RNA helicase UAP56/SUB2